MNQADQLTLDGVPAPKNKGGRPRKHASDADRVAACRAKRNLCTLAVDIDCDLVEAMEEYMRFKNLTKREVIEKLIRTQLLRKR